jgi:hypothetical protein
VRPGADVCDAGGRLCGDGRGVHGWSGAGASWRACCGCWSTACGVCGLEGFGLSDVGHEGLVGGAAGARWFGDVSRAVRGACGSLGAGRSYRVRRRCPRRGHGRWWVARGLGRLLVRSGGVGTGCGPAASHVQAGSWRERCASFAPACETAARYVYAWCQFAASVRACCKLARAPLLGPPAPAGSLQVSTALDGRAESRGSHGPPRTWRGQPAMRSMRRHRIPGEVRRAVGRDGGSSLLSLASVPRSVWRLPRWHRPSCRR